MNNYTEKALRRLNYKIEHILEIIYQTYDKADRNEFKWNEYNDICRDLINASFKLQKLYNNEKDN